MNSNQKGKSREWESSDCFIDPVDAVSWHCPHCGRCVQTLRQRHETDDEAKRRCEKYHREELAKMALKNLHE